MMKTEEMVDPVVTEATSKARENPWMIIGVAALVGCVIGYLLRTAGD
jgi:ElaB/YqjD/DUF883 family membrane-anchored ribosome-binding protein